MDRSATSNGSNEEGGGGIHNTPEAATVGSDEEARAGTGTSAVATVVPTKRPNDDTEIAEEEPDAATAKRSRFYPRVGGAGEQEEIPAAQLFGSAAEAEEEEAGGTGTTRDDDLITKKQDKIRSSVKTLAQLICRLLECSEDHEAEEAHREILRFFRNDGNFECFQGRRGDLLWLGRAYCATILRCDPFPPPRRPMSRPGPPGVAPPPVRNISSFIECLLAKSRWHPAVPNLLKALVRQHPEIVGSLRRDSPDDEDGDSTTPIGGGSDVGVDPETFLQVAVQRAPNFVQMIRLFATPELAMVPSANGWVPLHWSAASPSNNGWAFLDISDYESDQASVFLIDLNPHAAAVLDPNGRLPIHRFLERRCCRWPAIDRFVEAKPDSLSIPDPITGICPIVNILEAFSLYFQDLDRDLDSDEYYDPDRFSREPLAGMVASVARMIREHRPAALEDPRLHLHLPCLERHRIARFQGPLLYACWNCPVVDLLVPIIDMCPISLVCEWQVRREPNAANPMEQDEADPIDEDDQIDEDEDDDDQIDEDADPIDDNDHIEEGADADDDDDHVEEVDDDDPAGDEGDIEVDMVGAHGGAGNGEGIGAVANAEPPMIYHDDGSAWNPDGIPLKVVKGHPNVTDAAVDCVERATSDMFVALLEALLAYPVRHAVLGRIGEHCPDYDADRQSLTTLVEISREQGNNDELRADVIGADAVQELLRDSPKFRDCATGLYRMNRHPDTQCFVPGAEASRELESTTIPRASLDPIRALTAIQECANGNLDCIYIKLRSCPASSWSFWTPSSTANAL